MTLKMSPMKGSRKTTYGKTERKKSKGTPRVWQPSYGSSTKSTEKTKEKELSKT